jgi:hypothetical protein
LSEDDQKFVGCPLFNDLAIRHKDHAMGNATCEVHLMGYDDHGHTSTRKFHHHIKYLVDHFGIKRRGWLIEQHRFRLHSQRSGNGYALLLATGKLGGNLLSLFSDTNALKQR